MSKQFKEQQFIGTTVQTNINKIKNTISNYLVIITLTKVENKYYIANTFYTINPNIKIDYKQGCKEKKFTNININLTDLVYLTNTYYETSSFLDNKYIKNRINLLPNQNSSIVWIYNNKYYDVSSTKNIGKNNNITSISKIKYLYTSPSIYYILNKIYNI